MSVLIVQTNYLRQQLQIFLTPPTLSMLFSKDLITASRNASIVLCVFATHLTILGVMQGDPSRRVFTAVSPKEILIEIRSIQSTPDQNQRSQTRQPKLIANTSVPFVEQPLVASQVAIANSVDASAIYAPVSTGTLANASEVNTSIASNSTQVSGEPPGVELPSSEADYLNNPKPQYPVLSRRLQEQGKVIVRVLVGVDGLPLQATVKTSSGYERLDKAALNTVLSWRYIPGKRGGVPEAMWSDVPVNWVLS